MGPGQSPGRGSWGEAPGSSQEPTTESIKRAKNYVCRAFSLYCMQSQEKDILKLQTMQNSGIFRTHPKPAQIIIH